MRDVKRSSLLGVMLVLMLLLAGTVAEAVPHDSFMGIKWGTDIKRFPGVDWNGWDYDWKLYVEMPGHERLKGLTKTQDIKKLDGFPVSMIMYNFLDMRFSSVDILFAQDAWIEPVEYFTYLKKTYGENTYYDEQQSVVAWQYDDDFMVVANLAPTIPNTFMILHIISPQEARYRGLVK